MPHAPDAGPVAAGGTSSNQLKIHIPEHNDSTNGAHNPSNGVMSPNSNGLSTPNSGLLSPSSNGPLSPISNGLLSPPLISDSVPRKPPKPPPSRPILPMKKSKTLPIHFEETVPPKTPTTLLNGKKLFSPKPLREVHTVPVNPPDNSRLLVNRSPSPSYRRSTSSASVETGSIAELAKRHVPSNLLTSRSPSPISQRSNVSQYSTCSSNGTFVPLSRSSSMNSSIYSQTPTPRRMYPQTSDRRNSVDLTELRAREQAPVVFDANLQFVLGCNRQPVRQRFKPRAAHLEEGTSSNYLSAKIDNFLKKTDHVMDEWRRLGHKDDPDCQRKVGRSKSATNIMIKGFTLFSRSTSRASSMCRGISEDRTTVSEMDEVGD